MHEEEVKKYKKEKKSEWDSRNLVCDIKKFICVCVHVYVCMLVSVCACFLSKKKIIFSKILFQIFEEKIMFLQEEFEKNQVFLHSFSFPFLPFSLIFHFFFFSFFFYYYSFFFRILKKTF